MPSAAPSPLTLKAKKILSDRWRGLHERLPDIFKQDAEREYRLSVPLARAGLPEARRIRRKRLEDALDQRVRGLPDRERKTDEQRQAARDRFLREAEREAAYTLLHRMVFVRLLEARGLSRTKVVTGGKKSHGYTTFRDFAPDLCRDPADPTEGYGLLLRLIFEELALELPGLFGEVGLCRLFPVSEEALQAVLEVLNDSELRDAWADDTTLGWVYQYWNDPRREALDTKIKDGGKIEPHEIASKTQMFTERYMVEWLLHNSLGLLWLLVCKKNGWRADAEDVLPVLEERRRAWRERRERGEVPPDELMPIEGDLEEHWKYYVMQPLPEAAVRGAPETLRGIKVLDPACGSGHFLVISFDLLAALHREEARHRGQSVTEEEIARWIIEENLHGVDIDPRAVQIAAMGLYLKGRELARGFRPRRMNLVAPALRLAELADDDPALRQLRREVKREAGIDEALTDRIVAALRGADHLGTLLRVDQAVDEALRVHERSGAARGGQGDLFVAQMEKEEARATVLEKLEQFLAHHATEEDLGLRLGGEQLVAGVRFIRMMKEGTYDLVVGNPPYQGTAKMAEAGYVTGHYPAGKADLYAAFLLRALELARPGGFSAMLTMRGWMFVEQYEELRKRLLRWYDLRTIGDVDRGAFSDVPDEVLAACMTVFRKRLYRWRCVKNLVRWPERRPHRGAAVSVALQPTPPSDKSRDSGRTARKRAAVLAQVGRFDFTTENFRKIHGFPIVYWWPLEFIEKYAGAKKISEMAPTRRGVATGTNERFIRIWWELERDRSLMIMVEGGLNIARSKQWIPFVGGADGRVWIQELSTMVNWDRNGIQIATSEKSRFGRGAAWYFRKGISFSMIGNEFSARVHRYIGIFGDMGASVFPSDIASTLCVMNCRQARTAVESLNPGIHFQLTDVNRLPIFPIEGAAEIYATIERAFSEHEAAREASVEFRRPGPSPWRYAQDWAQRAVDRPAGTPLPPYEPVYDQPTPADFLSFALGVALGRFDPDGAGLLPAPPDTALPAGILFLSRAREEDSLKHPATALLHNAWAEHGPHLSTAADLRAYLCQEFFSKDHKDRYENRPIYFPLSSQKRNFVAWVSIHRFTDSTLAILLSDHLLPERLKLEGQIEDLRRARAGAGRAAADRRLGEISKLHEELCAFIDAVTACADSGPPPSDERAPGREADARYHMDLDDGVMVNSAGLWPLLEPQWKDPRKWWRELCAAQGRKDYDWAHLAARYFPRRVDQKCQKDPSLAVAHGCFWRYHPARAFSWELRLLDEIGPHFALEERDAEARRAAFLTERPDEALLLIQQEAVRRRRKLQKDHPGAEIPILAQRYPSIWLPHGRLWQEHPALVYACELMMQHDFHPAFTVDEPGSNEARARFLADHPAEAARLRAEEERRRSGKGKKGKKAKVASLSLPFADEADEDSPDQAAGGEDE